MRISKKLGAGTLAATVALLSCQLFIGCGSTSDDSGSGATGGTPSGGEGGGTAGKGGTSSTAGKGGTSSTAGKGGTSSTAGKGGTEPAGGAGAGGAHAGTGGASGGSGGASAGTGGASGGTGGASAGTGGASAGTGGAHGGTGGASAGTGGASAGTGGASAGTGGASGGTGGASAGTGGASAGTGGASGGTGGASAGTGGASGSGGSAPVCGNSIKETGEVCDPKFTVNDCGSDCKAITSASCVACENTVQGGAAGPNCPGTTCDTVPGNATAGTGSGTPRKQLCNEVLDCVRDSGCAAGGKLPINCYCGAVTQAVCSAGGGIGACKAVLERGLETTDFNTMTSRLGNTQYGGGKAMDRINCDQTFCDDTGASACF